MQLAKSRGEEHLGGGVKNTVTERREKKKAIREQQRSRTQK